MMVRIMHIFIAIMEIYNQLVRFYVPVHDFVVRLTLYI